MPVDALTVAVATTALRLADQSLERSHSALGANFRRLRARLGVPKAITALAKSWHG